MNLVCRSSLPLKQGESYMGERACLRSARRPIFSLHESVVGCGCAEGNPVAFIVSAHTNEIGAPGHPSFEMVDVRRFQLWTCRLIMTAVLIQPGYRIWIGAAIVGARF